MSAYTTTAKYAAMHGLDVADVRALARKGKLSGAIRVGGNRSTWAIPVDAVVIDTDTADTAPLELKNSRGAADTRPVGADVPHLMSTCGDTPAQVARRVETRVRAEHTATLLDGIPRPRLLDLFCCAGIGGDGYAAAGFDVHGVDVDSAALRNNPHPHEQRDALEVLADSAFLAGFDAIHASPPCQAYSITKHTHSVDHPQLLEPVLEALRAQPLPWVVENVPGAPMPGALVLCGSEFGLRAYDPRSERVVALKRHRLFLASFDLWGAGGCTCSADRAAQRIAGVYAGARADHVEARTERRGGYAVSDRDAAAALLGITRESTPPIKYQQQCIPPAYTRHVGEQLLSVVRERQEA